MSGNTGNISNNYTRIILHVDMDYFFAQCEEIIHPEIKGKPVVICVYSGRGGDSGAVSTSNYHAREYGIKAGIPISRAKKLKPDAVFLPVNMELYRSISDEVMGILKGYSDTIEQESIDEAFCDVSRKLSGFDEAPSYAVMIKDKIKEKVGLTCSVGVAPNKLVAKIASDFQKPDGLTIVKPGEVTEFLAQLKITDIPGVGKKTGERLNELGVMTIGDMSGLSTGYLIHEFGQVKGVWLKEASMGIDQSSVEERGIAEQIGRITTLKEDTDNPDVISGVIDELSGDVYRKLTERKLTFKSVTFIAISTDFKTRTKTHTLGASAKDLLAIRNTAHGLMKEFLAGNDVKLRRVGVRVAILEKDKGQKTLGEF